MQSCIIVFFIRSQVHLIILDIVVLVVHLILCFVVRIVLILVIRPLPSELLLLLLVVTGVFMEVVLICHYSSLICLNCNESNSLVFCIN